jgi:hypothetical protein
MQPSRQWLPFVLFGLTLGRHNVVDFLALLFDNAQFARRALFYAAAGIVGASLYSIVWLLTPWRPAETRIAVALVCCWGILEEAQTTVCRIGLGLSRPAPELDPWRGICDQLSGLPISTMTLAIPVCIVYWLAHNKRGMHGQPAA